MGVTDFTESVIRQNWLWLKARADVSVVSVSLSVCVSEWRGPDHRHKWSSRWVPPQVQAGVAPDQVGECAVEWKGVLQQAMRRTGCRVATAATTTTLSFWVPLLPTTTPTTMAAALSIRLVSGGFDVLVASFSLQDNHSDVLDTEETFIYLLMLQT